MPKRANEAGEYDGSYDADGQKKQHQDGDRLRLLILSRYGGPLIGKGGENFKRLREQYDVKITGLNSRAMEEVLQLVGPRSDYLAIVKEILPQCPEARYPSSTSIKSAMELNLLANTNCVGAIIGKKGSRMKEIVEQTGITLKVYPECLPNSNERVVAIGGKDEETVVNGLETVLKILDEIPVTIRTVWWKPENGPADSLTNKSPNVGMQLGNQLSNNMGIAMAATNMSMPLNNMNLLGNNMTMAQNMIAAPAVDEMNIAAVLVQQRQLREQSGIDMSEDFGSVETVTTLTLSNELCGVVIGQGGTNIKYIKQVSGAKVQTSRSEKGSDEKRTITLTGTQDQIQVAEQLMAQCIRAGKRQPPQQQQQKMGQSLPVKLPWGGAQGRGRFMVS